MKVDVLYASNKNITPLFQDVYYMKEVIKACFYTTVTQVFDSAMAVVFSATEPIKMQVQRPVEDLLE